MSTAQRRQALLRDSDGYAPIGSYAAIGDGRTVALIARDGSIDWLSARAIDGEVLFGALLDPARCGSFELCPTDGDYEVQRRYLDRTNVLESTFLTETGVVTVTDALNLQDGGELSWIELARKVRCLQGEVAMRCLLRPRFALGEAQTRLLRHRDAILAGGGELNLAFQAWGAGELQVSAEQAHGTFSLRAEQEALLACVIVEDQPIPRPPRAEVEVRLTQTPEAWRRWLGFHSYEGPWKQAVERSLLALKLLANAQTGAIAAAATTSLPERIGGGRNYDYRYAWIRDSAFALDALGAAGYREQVHASLSWVLASSAATHPRLEPFYTLEGEVPRGQRELPLAGYRGSRPVRAGNNASGQLQLGCYGNLLETVELYVSHGNELDRDTATRVAEVADQVCRIWESEDSGIWELPARRHYTTSKMNCWVALDRALKLAAEGQVPAAHTGLWREQAQRIRDWIERNCFSERKRSYTFFAGAEDLDASVLLAARTRYCAGTDSRLHDTVDAIRRELSAGGPLLYRYSGQRQREGAFLACSFWLVEALARIGRLGQARETMEEMLALSNDVGLYAEELDPETGEMLGNFPQGLTHLALVNAAHTFASAEKDKDGEADV